MAKRTTANNAEAKFDDARDEAVRKRAMENGNNITLSEYAIRHKLYDLSLKVTELQEKFRLEVNNGACEEYIVEVIGDIGATFGKIAYLKTMLAVGLIPEIYDKKDVPRDLEIINMKMHMIGVYGQANPVVPSPTMSGYGYGGQFTPYGTSSQTVQDYNEAMNEKIKL